MYSGDGEEAPGDGAGPEGIAAGVDVLAAVRPSGYSADLFAVIVKPLAILRDVQF